VPVIATERGIELEILLFGADIGAVADPAQAEFRDALAALAKQGVPIHVCRQAEEAIGPVEAMQALGFGLEYARDAFIRFTLEGATVISL
ncbi:MAG: hypothetical protein ACUVSD_12645, partial [Thiobacillaceae bacterium]